MAATGRHATDTPARLREAGFVRLAPAATGDGVAAAGLLARALEHVEVPYQVTLVTGEDTRTTEADLVVALDSSVPDAELTLGTERPASASAFEITQSLDSEAIDPELAAAGVLAADSDPVGDLADTLAANGIERRPGVAVPTEDLADGLAHSTLVHAPFSGDPDAAQSALEDRSDPDDDEEGRRVASLVALRTTDAAEATASAAACIERALNPHAGGPFETLEGYADVLSATVNEAPGTAIALALGQAAHDDALAAWRRHARVAHRAVNDAELRRHAGFVTTTIGDGPVETVARLVADFRSPEPLALVVGDERVALAATEQADADRVLDAATAALEGSGPITGDSDLASSRFAGDRAALVDAIREVMRDE